MTLIVCDANRDLDPYHDLLTGLRSRGRRVVVVGSRYRSDASTSDLSSNGVEATVFMSKHEEDELANLVEHYVGPSDRAMERPEHILAFLYQLLPASRPRIGAGLSAEARSTERWVAFGWSSDREGPPDHAASSKNDRGRCREWISAIAARMRSGITGRGGRRGRAGDRLRHDCRKPQLPGADQSRDTSGHRPSSRS